MDSINLHTIAGTMSTIIFITSTVPMLTKAAKTRDLKSYSFSNIALSNVGNMVHWVYVLHLPFGPIWFLHGFFTLSTAFMFVWYVRYEGTAAVRRWVNDRQLVTRVRCAVPGFNSGLALQPCGCT